MKQLRDPEIVLEGLDPETAVTLVTTATDVTLVIDQEGVIRDIALGGDGSLPVRRKDWLGRPWAETVSAESRPKVEAMLRKPDAVDPTKWRQVMHLTETGVEFPVLYATVRPGGHGQIVALGRDMRSVATLQQRLINAQHSLERHYARLRHMETRYRLLFKLTTEAVLFIDGASRRVVEANPAALSLFGETARHIVGRAFPFGFSQPSTQEIETLLAGVRTIGTGDPVVATLAESSRAVLVSAALFRQERATQFLVRLTPQAGDRETNGVPPAKFMVLDAVEAMPDGFVVTDLDGRILTANASFLDLAQLATQEQARGQFLGRFLGRAGMEFNSLLVNLRDMDLVTLMNTTLQGEYGSVADVEISAVSAPLAEQPCLGFVIRDVSQRHDPDQKGGGDFTRSVDHLADLVGRVPLKDIIRDTNDIIERLCIQAALELTGDNRASAAEMLGLSRQSLYVKLRRHGIGDLDGDREE
ncbi:transcriptional regulator PpsR [Rhodospirillum rubrum]|uniref:Transcriptional regulator, Fis family / DNA-binding protein Fis n=2 Tax=Rhodospirillum rubrum TaxID=1085 RepID=Q2RWR5_RHORT|nr:transcriptional regulator PpsR [Rhodospirillum rubrum]ABC21430.1 transcriptional regulator, Fis family / DNA-binding protein Fis [Rhodospirillum rubrum ATCC 11170]AEO47112.1 Fis family transcriptional regulator [Rhodospirillum rubrum F11]MBK5953024.1 transcriptional regulator PpsR [Rhodospirillum rubrum]QXG81107.1 transcriptional regulator PpsR [Rhodospirillum rubrum]CAC84414.1 PPSR protein [Rhodospirillum rubrum ATCC 11170]